MHMVSTKFLLYRYGLKDTDDNRYFFHFISNATYFDFKETPKFTNADPTKWLSILNDLKPHVSYFSSNGYRPTWIVTERGFCMAFNNHASLYSTIE